MFETKITGLPRGVFTVPTMDWSWSGLDKHIIGRVNDWATRSIWGVFWKRDRRKISLTDPATRNFWLLVAREAATVGAPPIMLLPNKPLRRMVMDWKYDLTKRPTGLLFESKPGVRSNQYIATIEGIDVHFVDLMSGYPTIIFSNALRAVVYRPVRPDRGIVDLEFVPEEDPWRVSLCIKISQSIRWNNSPILEIDFPIAEARANATEDDI